jgi:PTS system nitrogen regulatory IIA component
MVDVDDFLSPDRLILGFPGSDKRQLFQDLADLASRSTGLDREQILGAIEQREKLGTTGIGDGIAIPHARMPGLDRLTGFFVRLATPIEYDALDDAPVDLVFLLIAPEAASTLQLKALARIARLLRDPELGARLRTEPAAEQIYDLLRGRIPGQAA